MRLVVLGATGRCGQCLVKQALEANHEVTAIVRNPAKLGDIQHEKLSVVEGDIFSAESLQSHFEGCDAVMSCLGGGGFGALMFGTTVYSDSMKTIVSAMRNAKVKRIIIITSWFIKILPEDDPGFVARWIVRPMLRYVLENMGVMEQYLAYECQDLDYTTVRPAGLTNKPSQADKDFIVETERYFCDTPPQIARADVARFMLQCLGTDQYIKKVVSIGIK